MAFSEDSPETKISRLTTWFEAPSTGDLFFWISSRGATKLVVSQPDSVLPMAKGGLLYITDSLGWPKEGQWDLYPSQRLGPGWTSNLDFSGGFGGSGDISKVNFFQPADLC